MPQQVRDAALRATPFPLMCSSLYRKRRRSRRFSRAADEVARPSKSLPPTLTASLRPLTDMTSFTVPKVATAVVFDQHKGPLRVEREWPVVEPEVGEVLVKIAYSGVCRECTAGAASRKERN